MSATRDIVVQGEQAAAVHARELAALCGAANVSTLSPTAYRLEAIANTEGVAAYCDTHSLDCALVPASLRLGDFKLLAMDMDSTLITIECIDELADMAGIKAIVAGITESAMRGEIDFQESLRQRVALLAGLPVSTLQRVYDERVRLTPGAESLLKGAKAAGLRTLLVSGGFTFFVERLRDRLGLDYAYSNVLESFGDALTGRVSGRILDAQGKAQALKETAAAIGASAQQVIAIGDGANDLPMMQAAGISIAYRAKPLVRSRATYALNHSGLDGVLNLFG